MAIFKCKMCGGDLNVTGGADAVECEFCGTMQTVPTTEDENLHKHFNRANLLRRKSEFDKAEQIYESIIRAKDDEAEAYWGLILCKYGIEYVEDPATLRRVPTCHRASFDSVLADEDYKSAIKYADAVQRGIYEAEAREIDRLQKDILALSRKEKPYDVFICYKETDETGARTPDSVIANDIYYQLTQEGYKVFYAAITLEDKLGQEYEPYIFAALNSAKVMLAIGTKAEYFNAVWVRNEWSRFLKMMKKDRSKLLIPCYRDMDAYDLPEEFSHLQAQDMSKIGFINDLVRGISKVIKKEEKKDIPASQPSQGTAAPNAEPLVKRAYLSLEDGDWKKADEFCEQALNADPENAMAYLGKVMSQYELNTIKGFSNLKLLGNDLVANGYLKLRENRDFKKFLRFAGKDIAEKINNYIDESEHNEREQIKAYKYENANSFMTDEQYRLAKKIFKEIAGFKDADVKAAECSRLEAEALQKHNNALENKYQNARNLMNKNEYNQAYKMFKDLHGYKDSKSLADRCSKKIRDLQAYSTLLNSIKNDPTNSTYINKLLSSAVGKHAKCEYKAARIAELSDSMRSAITSRDELLSSETKKIQQMEASAKDNPKVGCFFTSAAFLVLFGVCVFHSWNIASAIFAILSFICVIWFLSMVFAPRNIDDAKTAFENASKQYAKTIASNRYEISGLVEQIRSELINIL